VGPPGLAVRHALVNPREQLKFARRAQATLSKHARDKSDPVYSPEQFDVAQTHDPLWNAAQKELLLHGKIHGYHRMYWVRKSSNGLKHPLKRFGR
jgi:deoxyribodipyrimidine photo-lyase